MCEPTTMVAIAMAATAAGTAYKANSEYQSGIAQESYNNYLAQQSEQEAILSERTGRAQAIASQESGAFRSKVLAKQQAKEGAKQKAALSAAGREGGTSEDILSESLQNQLLDMETLRFNADLEGNQAITDGMYRAWSAKNQSNQYKMAAKEAKRAGKRNMWSTLLSGAATTAMMGAGAGGGSGSYAVPGFQGYGRTTPLGTKNMGTWSKLR